jgi:sterigmatocystin 8-O-methyltransferase
MTPNKSVLLIDDIMDPGSGGPYSSHANCMNLHMLACFGTLFKTKEQWEELFSSSKLEIVDRRSDGWKVSFWLNKSS